MLKTRNEVYEYILQQVKPLSKVENGLKPLYNYIRKTYNIPKGMIFDICTEQVEEIEAVSDEFVLYAIVDAINQKIDGKNQYNVEDVFTEIEINRFKNGVYHKDDVIFPLAFDAIQINADQFLTTFSVDDFMKYNKAGLIRYNPNTQRALKRIENGNEIEYKIDINKYSIRSIREMYRNKTYISNDIVLNMGESDRDFVYDEEERKLYINNINHFDMIDGYNRYYAMCQEKYENPGFSVNFVVQIMDFSEQKAQQYIFQQDLKIKMQQIDVSGMNKNAPENQIVERLNETYGGCGLKGCIGRNNSLINGPELASAIRRFWFKSKNSLSNKEIKDISTEISGKTNLIIELYPELKNSLGTYKRIVTYTYFINNYIKEDTTPNESEVLVNKFKTVIDNVDKEIELRNKIVSKKDIDKINELIEKA